MADLTSDSLVTSQGMHRMRSFKDTLRAYIRARSRSAIATEAP